MLLKKYSIEMDSAAAKFYETAAEKTGTTAEKLMAESLFNLAGEISLKAVLKNPGR